MATDKRTSLDDLDDVIAAREILSTAKGAALDRLIDEVHAFGRVFDAAETYRWAANAYDHLTRAQRVLLGLEERGDPILPTWNL